MNFVSTTQMPLFAICSGFVFSLKENWIDFITKKTERILIPFFVFSVLLISVKYIGASFSKGGEIKLLQSIVDILNGNTYWYLYILLLMMLLTKVMGKYYWILTVSMLVLSFTPIIDVSFCQIFRVVLFLPYFHFGIALRLRYHNILKMSSMLLIPIAIFLGCAYYFITSIDCMFIRLYIKPLVACGCIWLIVLSLSKLNLPVFKHFGKYSLQYYLNHKIIILPLIIIATKIPANHFVQLSFIFCCTVFASYLMLMVEQNITKLSNLCGLR
jgi:hypothetical protein